MADQSDIVGRIVLSTAVQTHDVATPADTLDAAVQSALAPDVGHFVITAAANSAGYQVNSFGPAQTLSAPPVATVGSATAVALAINGGERLYLSADPEGTSPGGTSTRWVDVPGLKALYRLPEVDLNRARNRWADRLSKVVPDLDQTTARALPIPLLRTRLAQHGAAAFPVSKIHRGDPPVDAGGIVNGITEPTLRLPLREPDCYLTVIAQVEGRLESINAWDLGAGVSLGVIQFNADRGALFRFLWQVWTDDPDLFAAELTEPLGWTMSWDEDHADLVVGEVRLHGRGADKARNAAYLQTGIVDGTGRDAVHRRKVATALRNCVVWPHVQDMIVDTSSWYLQPALANIRAEGIGPLDAQAPDHDTFILTALLLSGGVRFSGCLKRLLVALRPWTTTSDKLENWQQALATTTDPCPSLLKRLKNQQPQAELVYEQVLRLLQ
jgi:hypothetical protein